MMHMPCWSYVIVKFGRQQQRAKRLHQTIELCEPDLPCPNSAHLILQRAKAQYLQLWAKEKEQPAPRGQQERPRRLRPQGLGRLQPARWAHNSVASFPWLLVPVTALRGLPPLLGAAGTACDKRGQQITEQVSLM